MALTIFSFKRAFTAKQGMALAIRDCTTPVCAIEAKDMSDCLHLGVACGIIHAEKTDNSAVDEFITECGTILEKLSGSVKNAQVTIPLSTSQYLCLKEENDAIRLTMGDKQVILPNLTLQNLYERLIGDIRNYPDLYGHRLSSYVNHLNKELFVA